MSLSRDLDSDWLFKSSSTDALTLDVPFRPQRLRPASVYKNTMSSILRFCSNKTQSHKAALIEAGSPQRCPHRLCDVAIWSEMSWKSCCHEVGKERRSTEGNGLWSEPDLTFDNRRAALCVSGHTEVYLAGVCRCEEHEPWRVKGHLKTDIQLLLWNKVAAC